VRGKQLDHSDLPANDKGIAMKALTRLALLLSAGFIACGAWAQENRTPEQPTVAASTEAPLPEIYRQPGQVITPPSSMAAPGRVHTNYKIFVPAGRPIATPTPENTFAETPDSLACVYKVGPAYAGCTPVTNNGNIATGGWGAIALVDAYDDPTAANDISVFSTHFGIPAPKFMKVIANSSFGALNGLTASCAGTPANANGFGWDIEESLDVQWAHAMAPKAAIILVEACTSSINDLLYAVEVAGIEVAKHGGGVISMSWGGSEFAGETTYDYFLFQYYWKNTTYIASAGDSASEVIWPSASPWVVSAGGTTVNRDASGNFLSESCWADSGGGPSTVEQWTNPPTWPSFGPWTGYQYTLTGGPPFQTPFRETPDMSFDADPNSGVYVYDTDAATPGYYIVGGTSLSAPALAGIINASGNKLGQAPPGGGAYAQYENNLLYSQLFTAKAYGTNFYDVTTGSNGQTVGVGYDECTGVGSPRGHLGK
jgi:subtilase family serine protease